MATIVRGNVLLLFGPWAEVVIPERDYRDPIRLDAAPLAEQLGVPVADLPGLEFEVTFAGTPDQPELSDWRKV